MGKEENMVVAGYYGFGNLGDEAIRTALMDALRSRGFRPVVLVARAQEQDEVKRTAPMRVFRALRRSLALVFGGGGLLQNRTSRRSLFYYLGLILLARIARRPVFLLGQGIGPIRGKIARSATRFALSGVSYRGCRDRGSLSTIRGLGLEGTLDGDLFFLTPPVGRLEGPRSSKQELRILLSLTAPDRAAWGRCVAGWTVLLETLRAKIEFKVTFLPFFPAQDRPFAEEISAWLSYPCEIRCPGSIEEGSEAIANADLLIASRLHPLEFALRVGTPMLAVAEDPKITAFVEEVRSVDGPALSCLPSPTAEEILSVLRDPPSCEALQAAYKRLHERVTAAFARFRKELEAIPGKGDD